jgi:hypothetical protein
LALVIASDNEILGLFDAVCCQRTHHDVGSMDGGDDEGGVHDNSGGWILWPMIDRQAQLDIIVLEDYQC